MALSHYEQRVIAQLESRLVDGDHRARRLRRSARWLTAGRECGLAAGIVGVIAGIAGVVAGLLWWWPLGGAGYGLAVAGVMVTLRETRLRLRSSSLVVSARTGRSWGQRVWWQTRDRSEGGTP